MKRKAGSVRPKKAAGGHSRRGEIDRQSARDAQPTDRGSVLANPYDFLSAAVNSKSVAESWHRGLRKLEEVFDERVASALERLGIPSAAALARLERKVDQLAIEIGRSRSRHRRR